jgi:hypothetical protein
VGSITISKNWALPPLFISIPTHHPFTETG